MKPANCDVRFCAARSLATAIRPALAGYLFALPFSGLPLVLCGVLKIAYDVALLGSFHHIKPPEEQAKSARGVAGQGRTTQAQA